MSQEKDTLLDGRVVVVAVDTDGRILKIRFPDLSFDGTGDPLEITYSYGQTVSVVENEARIRLGLPAPGVVLG